MTHIHDEVLPEGTQIGVHEIKDASHIGSFGITYRAWNHHLKGWVEMQEYFPDEFAVRGPDGLGVEPKSPGDRENFEFGLKAFLDQAEILTQIEHPNIAVAENTLQFNGTAYLILDYQQGVPLSGLERSPTSFAESELKFILVSILNALQEVHDHKLVHGGIQPETILLGKDGEPVLINFATARLAIAARAGSLASELRSGYAPAEQYELDNQPGPATDFYALGATMYQCITGNEPADAQDRVMALSKGEPDPIIPVSGTQDGVYSEDLLETIDWMLCPDYNDRPQLASEILAALKQGPVHDQAGSSPSGKGVVESNDSETVATDRWWIGAMIGVAALTAIGLWLLQPGENSSELLDDKISTVTSSKPPQQSTVQAPVEEPNKEKESDPLSVAESGQPTDVEKISEAPKAEIGEAQKGAVKPDDKTSTRPLATENSSDNGGAANSNPVQERAPAADVKLSKKTVATPDAKTGESQQLAVVDKSTSPAKKPDAPKLAASPGAIAQNLTAAEEAFKAMRFTTPVGDNAYEYYQTVLAMDPDNQDALGGLQKMVDWYVQLIEKAQAEGQPKTARVYLRRAEAVLPDAPNLQSLRAELAAPEE